MTSTSRLVIVLPTKEAVFSSKDDGTLGNGIVQPQKDANTTVMTFDGGLHWEPVTLYVRRNANSCRRSSHESNVRSPRH